MLLSDVELQEKLQSIRALLLDCDGVLSDGHLLYSENGPTGLRFFAQDGLGLAVLARTGVRIGIISGRSTDIAEARHKELGVEFFVGKCRNKSKAIREILEAENISPEEVIFVGDDLADLGAFQAVGVRIAVQNAVPELKERAHYITKAAGGYGAVREVTELVLRAQNRWEEILLALERA